MIAAAITVVLVVFGALALLMLLAIATPLLIRMFRGESLVPKSTKRAIGQKLEEVHRTRRVREAIEDLAADLPPVK